MNKNLTRRCNTNSVNTNFKKKIIWNKNKLNFLISSNTIVEF